MSRDALIVGINAYQYLPSLQAPARDAEAIAQQIQTYGEFRVHRLPEVIQTDTPQIGLKTKVSLRELETALVNLFKPKGNQVPQTALFYFSGHGLQKEAGIQEGYLAVSDTNPEASFYGLSLFWLRRLLQESPVRQRIVWLDCCHSGELLNFLEADPGAQPATDRLFMAASRDYETAYESLTSPYSVFTQALLTGLDPRRTESGIVTDHSLIDYVNQTLKTEIQRPLFESSGSEIILTRCLDQSRLPVSKPSTKACPYIGLKAFNEAQAEYFCGREELLRTLISSVEAKPFVALVGASGSGKTSLVQAGLLPYLRQQSLRIGVDAEQGQGGWQIKLITPTEHPLKQLATAFVETQRSQIERAEQLRRAEGLLEQGTQGLAQLVRATGTLKSELPIGIGDRPRLLLIIDQFEQLLTHCRGTQSVQERQQFIDCLVNALAEAGRDFKLLIILRSDFIAQCSSHSELASLLQHNAIAMTPMTYEQTKTTIVQPAHKAGLQCEPNLVYTMLLDVFGASGELPLLQSTLAELWHRRHIDSSDGSSQLTLSAYSELGGIRSTLHSHATQVFYALTPDEQRIAKRIFLALVQLGDGTEDTRRRALKSELVSAQFPMDQVEPVLEKLIAARLVVADQVVITTPLPEQFDRQFKPSPPLPITHRLRQKWFRTFSATRPVASGLDVLLKSSNDSFKPLVNDDASNRSVRYVDTVAISACQLDRASRSIACSHETIEVAHEALIRNWSLLRSWLEETRDRLGHQRRLEQAAQEWNYKGQRYDGNYLLQGGRLLEAEGFLTKHPDELSALAHWHVVVSRQEQQRLIRSARVRQFAIPSVVAMALFVALPQYRPSPTTLRSYLTPMTLSEQPSSNLSGSDAAQANRPPLSSLAIASQRSTPPPTHFQTVLQRLNLRVKLWEREGAIQQIAFSLDHRYVATANSDGTIRLWSTNTAAESSNIKPMHILLWDTPTTEKKSVSISNLLISPNGKLLAAVAQNSRQVKVWNLQSGTKAYQLNLAQPVTQAVFSGDGNWIAVASADRTVSLWQAQTGRLQTRFTLHEEQSDLY